MDACAKCGACSVVCPVYRVTGQEAHTARGKMHLATVPELHGKGEVFEDIFSRCLLCGACSAVCPRDIDVCAEVVRARAAFPAVYGEHGYEKFLARKALVHPELLSALRVMGRVGAGLSEHLPAESGLRLRLALFRQEMTADVSVPEQTALSPLGLQGGLTFFPGCVARHLFPGIAAACNALAGSLAKRLHVPTGLSCCGLAAHAAGDRAEARCCAERNIVALEQSSGPILVSCASCYAHLGRYGELFKEDSPWLVRAAAVATRLVELSCFLDHHPPPVWRPQGAGGFRLRVYYHDPCHLRHGLTIVKEPRRVLGRNADVELLELPDGPECCGQGGVFHIGAPEISAMIRDTLAAKVLAMGPDVITTTCSGCLMQWRLAVEAAGSKVKVLHLAELLGRGP